MKKALLYLLVITLAVIANIENTNAQIFEPEGINMPGAWNGWTNPPNNNLALASYTQVAGGQVTKISNGTTAVWNTIIHVSAGGDVAAGTYEWLYTSGPAGSPWNNKWADVNVSMNTIQNYTFGGGTNNSITLADNMWYTSNWEDIGYSDSRAIFMVTSAEPVEISTLSTPTNVMPNTAVNIDMTLAAAPSAEEVFYIRYSIDNWTTSSGVSVAMAGTSGSATIPGQAANTLVEYYAFSSTIVAMAADFDLQSIKFNNNAGANYSYTIGNPPPPTIDWVNLQWPESGSIDVGQAYNVYGQIYMNGLTDGAGQAADIQAWIGYSTTDTDPSTWTNWVPANYSGDVGNNDEYVLDLGNAIGPAGTYYYATRFQYQAQAYVYGGYNAGGGGFWDGTSNVNGTLTISSLIPLSNWSFLFFGLFFLTFLVIKFRK